jgi:Protein of unknown function (DUF2852)
MDVFDKIGKPVWLALMVLGFIFWWPAGLAVLAFLIITGRISIFQKGKWRMPALFGTGNLAFDEHRRETLEQMDKEMQNWGEFREKLAKAKDKAEFDQFMKEYKN